MRFGEHIFYDANNNAIIKTFHSTVSPSKRSFREHHHTECELSIFLSGRGIYLINGEEYSFESGDVFLFGSNEPHCITEISETFNLLNIHFEPRILWDSPENMELLQLFASRNSLFKNKFSHNDETLKNLLLRIEDELKGKKTGYMIEVKYLLFSALIHILRNYDYVDEETIGTKTLSSVPKMRDAMIYINKNIENPITLADIANVACMSQTYFSALFKKFNGISPWDYITIKRVELAIEMLRKNDMSKLEIAEKCGFSSSSNFYKAFFKVTGKKPGEYSLQKVSKE